MGTNVINVRSYDELKDRPDYSYFLQDLIDKYDEKIIYFPDGEYPISKPLMIKNGVSLLLNKGAILKPTQQMESLINYQTHYTQATRRKIEGGVFDGDGLVQNVIHISGVANLEVCHSIVKNGLQNNILIDNTNVENGSGYELHMHELFIQNELPYSVNPNLTGIYINTSDMFVENIIVKNCTNGIICDHGGVTFRNIHVWCGDKVRLPHTVGFNNGGKGNTITDSHMDTMAKGMVVRTNMIIDHCKFRNNEGLIAGAGVKPYFLYSEYNVADADLTKNVIVKNCYFECAVENDYIPTFIGGNVGTKFFELSDNLLSRPMYAVDIEKIKSKMGGKLNIIKYQKSYTDLQINANSKTSKRCSGLDLRYYDTVIVTRSGGGDNIQFDYQPLDNAIDLHIYNTSDSSLTTNITFYITVLKNYNNEPIEHIVL